MKRKLLQANASQPSAVTIRLGARAFEAGRATRRFDRLADDLLEKRARLYRKLAK